uniref:CHHC U11-48K-type domain-containing protein n=1 Tax=Dendroctonus ponderosae TaxID=77166 RepID=A0AAR5NZL4_DENPD
MATEMARCPFNKQHVMATTVLQRHIVKCMKNYPGWLVCPYNAMHQFPDTDTLTQHMLICPFKETVATLTQREYDNDRRKALAHAPVHIEGIREINLSEENWDEEYL